MDWEKEEGEVDEDQDNYINIMINQDGSRSGWIRLGSHSDVSQR